MNRDQLARELGEIAPAEGAVAHVARRGDDYTWAIGEHPQADDDRGMPPDAWIYYGGPWPATDEPRAPFVEDLLAEVESMTATDDRCRWPLQEPWQPAHTLRRINDDDPWNGMQRSLASSILRKPFTSVPPNEGDGPR